MTPNWKSALKKLRPSRTTTATRPTDRRSLRVERLEDRLTPAFMLRLEQAGFAPLTLTDNGPGDGSPVLGNVQFIGSYGTFNFNVTAVQTKPLTPNTNAGEMDFNTFSMSSTTGGTLVMTAGDTDYNVPTVDSNPLTIQTQIGGTLRGGGGSSVTFQSWANADNASPFDTPTTTIPAGSVTPGPAGPFTAAAYDTTISTAFNRNATPYSIFVQASLVLNGAGSLGFNAFTDVTAPPKPKINIVKLTNGTDNDAAPGLFVPVGGPVAWTYTVTNPGNEPVKNVVVTDDNGTPGNTGDDFTPTFLGGDANSDTLLDPTETWTYAKTGAIAVAGQYTNNAVVTGAGNTSNIPVTDDNPDNYFGYLPVRVGDFVWYDQNADGDQDVGEPGINGVTLQLTGTDVNGTGVSLTTTTAGNGGYLFDNLVPGTYSVAVTNPGGGFIPTVTGKGTAATDSNPSPTGTTPTALPSGAEDLTLDFGYYKLAKLGDFVWHDLDADGQQDAGEPGINGVLVTLNGTTGAGVPVNLTTTTAGNGGYLFDNLVPGTYKVTFPVVPGFTRTVADAGNDATDSDADAGTGMTGNYTLVAEQSELTVDAGYYRPAALGDFVWNDQNANGQQDGGEPGIAGVQVNLTGTDGQGNTVTGITFTGANGLYLFDNLVPGTYQVSFPTLTGFTRTVANVGADATDSDASATTGVTGNYTLVSGQTDLTVDAGYYEPVQVGNFVWHDVNANGRQDAGEPGIEGVTLTLTGTTGAGAAVGPQTTTTNAAGLYLFANLAPGTYTVAVTPPTGYDAASPTAAFVPVPFGVEIDSNESPTITAFLPGGSQDLTRDFGFYKLAALGDFVWHDLNANGVQDGGEPGIPNVTVNLKNANGTTIATTTTNASGVYGFTGLTPGTYSVQFVAPAGFAGVSPANVGANDAVDSDGVLPSLMTATTTLASGQTDPTLDQGFYKLAKLGDFVWNDLDADGQQDAGEPGINGVTVVLTGTDNQGNAVTLTTTTAGNGGYLFDNLVPGTYKVTFPVVPGFTRTVADAGNDATDSDADTGTGMTGNYTLVAGQAQLTVDAGYVAQNPDIDVEKTTDGPSNGNPVDSDYDNEDAANGPGVPILTPGTVVTWTYKVTNTGNVAFTKNDITLVDDNGTAATADDLSIANGKIAFAGVETGNADNVLDPGEVWIYTASGVVQNLATPGGASTVDFSGSSATSGAAGNVRTYSVGGVGVNVSAFSRDKGTGTWETAYLGAYGGGLGVTDGIEGTGANDTHTVDNVGRDNYVLFEFSETVVVDSAFLGYVVNDSDLTVWIGTLPDAFNNHTVLSDAVLAGLGFTEVNLTDLTTARLADLNAGNVAGNVLVIAADPGDATPEDRFKIEKLTVKKVQPGTYENKATVTAPGATPDSDLSHYKNPTAKIDIEKYVKEVTVVGGEGLTPGYWKQDHHFPTWVPTGYAPSNSFNTVFGVTDPDAPTLLQALQTGGGGFNALGRHAVAGLLNASHPTVEYKFTAAQVIAKVQSAYANPSLVESIKNELAAENERGADLTTNTGTATDPTPGNPGSDADVPQGLVLQTGEFVQFTFIVTNPGAVALANVVVTDDNQTPTNSADDFNPAPVLAGGFNVGDTDKDNQLDVGEAWKYTHGPILVTEGQHTNNATVTGTPVGGGSSVTDADPANWFGITDKDGTIKGKKFLDVSGNGLNLVAGTHSPADTPMGGVTIYLDADNDGVKDAGEQSTVTAADGGYQFTGLTPGTYIVREVVPAGYVRTNPTTTDYYAITISSGQVLAGYNFANAEKCEEDTITHLSFTIVSTDGTTRTVTDLRGNTREGDLITATFKVNVPTGQKHLVSFVSYTAPEPYFNANTAHLQEIYDLAQGEFGPGTHALTIRVPNCFYQVDLVCGDVIDKLGPAGSNIFYTPQMRLESADNGGTHACGTNPGTISGYKFLDQDADGHWDAGEPGLKNWTIYVDADNDGVKDDDELATVTDANGFYKFNNVPAGTHAVREVQQSGWHASRTPAAVGLTAGENETNVNFGNYQKATVTGYKFKDKNADGAWDRNGLDNTLGTGDDEVPLSGWTIYVDYDGDGAKDAGEPSAVTDANGYYSIGGIKPGTYDVLEVMQAGWIRTTDDRVVTLTSGECQTGVNFGNFQGNVVMSGDTATIGFWRNNNGQALIKKLNGGGTAGTATALGNWLASNFPRLYGSSAGSANNLTGKTNAQVAAYFVKLFDQSEMKLEAQVLATTLAVYVTDSDWAGGTYAASYGFTVNAIGVKNDYYNIGNNGAAFGVADGSALTVWDLLKRTNDRAVNGVLWGGDSTLRSKGNAVFTGINEQGDI